MDRIDQWSTTRVVSEMVSAYEAAKAGELAVLVGPDALPRSVHFECPCGCGQHVMLPAQGAPTEFRGRREWWQADLVDGRLTLSPSVRMLTGCGAHFFVRASRVVW